MKAGEMAASALISGKAGDYKKFWKNRFQNRFLLMKKLWMYFLKDDLRAEKLIKLYHNTEVQEASIRLWLQKDLKKESLVSYIKIFRKFLN